jgi:hypothetical protein
LRRYNKVNIGEVSRKIEVHQRHFEIWEAEEILPTLEFYVRDLQSEKKQIASLNDVLDNCLSVAKDSEKDVVTDPICINLDKKLKHKCGEYISLIEKIAELGVVVDDLDVMSFDFYSWLDGEEVMFCWQSGERSINYWHYPEESFNDRRVLDAIDVLTLDHEEQYLH